MKLNPLTTCDFYKTGHKPMYPEGTEMVYSNFTPRSTRLFPTVKSVEDNRVVFAGLYGFMQWFLIEVFDNGFFNQPKQKVVRAYKRRMDNALGPDAVDVSHIEALHDLGYLPLEIMALPEGSKVDPKVPVFTVHNTDSEFAWLVNYLETVFSNSIWKTMVNATIAYRYRQVLEKYAKETGTPVELVDIQAHDFSCRGMSGPYDAGASGIAHLTSFMGTDTISAIDYAEDYYNANSDQELIGCSVPATEHSVMCMGGKETELETFRRILELHPEGIVSIVSDTWDFWKVITELTVELKDEILNRKPNALGLAKTVFRPDSGDPVDILCGAEIKDFSEVPLRSLRGYLGDYLREMIIDETPHGEMGPDSVTEIIKYGENTYYEVTAEFFWNRHDKQYYYLDEIESVTLKSVELTPEQKGAVECLYDVFGGTKTETGHIMLNERVGLIYGDSITLERCEAICQRLAAKGFASGNVVFGIGSYTYQMNTRDTVGGAMKATYGMINGEGVEIFKDPVTDSGTKKSAKGLLAVKRNDEDRFELIDQVNWEQVYYEDNQMKTVFKDGELTGYESLAMIRERIKNS